MKCLGVSFAFQFGDFELVVYFKSLVKSRKFSEKLGVIIWFSNVCVVWKLRNGVIFSQKGFVWEKF